MLCWLILLGGGVIAYMVMLCLGELAVHLPVSGSFGAFATLYIGPGTGYMVSWMYWLGWSATLSTEFTAAAILVQEWFPQTSIWLWTLIFASGVLISNLSSTRAFAESEFWLSMIKVATVLIFILLGFACIFGIIPFQGYESAPLFNNLTAQGWLPNGLIPLFTTLLIVNFAFNGTEMIGIAAGETKNPEKMCPKPFMRRFGASLFSLLVPSLSSVRYLAIATPVCKWADMAA
nr:amino acid permease [Acinetobacter johnsonii]